MKGNKIMSQTALQQTQGRRKRAMIAVVLALLALAILSPFGTPAYAQDTTPRDTRTWTQPGTAATFTFSTPDIFNSCSTRGDRIYTIGLQPGWRLDGTVTVRQPNGSQIFTVIDVNQSVELDLLVPYPPVSQWQNNINNREIHVDLSIAVLDENDLPVSWIGDEPTAPGVLGPRQQDWDVFCETPLTPDIAIKKYTNGADADDPTAAGVPLIAAGAPVTWTYRLTNIGPVDIPFAEITVTDNIPGISPVFAAVISGDDKGDGSGLLEPGEVWEYTATGTAVNLTNPPGGQGLVLNPNACQQGNINAPGRNAYTNIGTVTIPNTSDADPSSYCNPEPPTGELTSVCVNTTRTWTVNVSQNGQYVAEFLVNDLPQSTLNLNLLANTPTNFTYSGDPTTLSGVRVTYNGAEVAVDSGPYLSCVPTATPTNTPTATPTNTPVPPTATPTNTPTATATNTPTATPTNTPTATATNTPTATPTSTPVTPSLTSTCVEDIRVWTVTSNNTGMHVVEFLVGGSVQSTVNLNLVAGAPTNFTYVGDPTTLSGVRVTFNSNVVASESGPYVDCAQLPTATLTSACVDTTRTWTVSASQSGAYVAEFLVGGNVQSTTNLNLTANTPATFTYSGDPTTLSGVRVTFSGNIVAAESGPYESCFELPSVTLTPRCTNEGLLWQVIANRTGSYVAQVVSNGSVIEQTTLNLTANQPQDVAFGVSSYTPNTVRIIYQSVQVLEQTGPEPCVDGLSAAMAPRCERVGAVWTVLVNRSGNYVAQLMSGTTVIESRNLALTNGLDVDFQFENDSTAPRFVRLIFQGAEYARQDGLNETCVPTALPPTEEPNLPLLDKFIYLPTVVRR